MPRKGRKYPYLPWWLYDYRSDPLVQAMSDDQDLAYRRMIEVSWDLGELENNPSKIASLIQFSLRKFASVWKYPLTECWHDKGVGLVNARLEREREKVEASYRQKKRAGEASGQARKKARCIERTLNGCSTDVERAFNDPNPDPDLDSKKNLLDLENGLFKEIGDITGAPKRSGSQSSRRPTKKAVTGKVRWDEEKRKLDATDTFRQDFLACWKKKFTVDEIKKEMIEATRWLIQRPETRSDETRLDLFLHDWMEDAYSRKPVALSVPSGVKWSKTSNSVEMTPGFRKSLVDHLKELATREELSPMTSEEMQESWGRLNGHLIANAHKRGPKTLDPIVRNWFENDIRRNDHHSKTKPRDTPFERSMKNIQTVLEEDDNGK